MISTIFNLVQLPPYTFSLGQYLFLKASQLPWSEIFGIDIARGQISAHISTLEVEYSYNPLQLSAIMIHRKRPKIQLTFADCFENLAFSDALGQEKNLFLVSVRYL